MSNTKLFYTYRDSDNGKEKLLNALSAYSDSLIFDEDNRRIWHRGHQYGNSYWGSYHGETFNDFKSNTASGDYSHAEGSFTTASGFCSHAEGESTIASAEAAHAEGLGTKADAEAAHAEGRGTIADQDYSHAEGNETIANGLSSHAEGISTKANGEGSHAEGNKTIANGFSSHAEGSYTKANEQFSHAEGLRTIASGEGSHAEGIKTVAVFSGSHAEGAYTKANEQSSHAEGEYTVAWTMASHAEGYSTKAGELAAHAEGLYTNAEGIGSHSEGAYTYTYGDYSHAGGIKTIARGKASHAEGNMTYAYGDYSHAEGDNTFTYKNYSHAEGTYTSALGEASHAEGDSCTAEGIGSHAEGFATFSQGDYSHTQGKRTFAFNSYEVSFGEFNESLNGEDISYKTVFSIGDGTDNLNRHNIIDFRKNGDMHKNGNSYFHDNIYGPVSYTYVKSLGESATLDIVLSSLLTQPEYTRPNITVKYSHSGNIEIGTYITPTITLEWPERSEHTNGTRAYTLENGSNMPNYLLGYSYGIKSIQISYNNGSKFKYSKYFYTYTGNGLNTYGLDTPLECNMTACYILDEGKYYLFKDLEVSYLASSYMYFQQLYDKGVYVYAYGLPPKNWIETGYATINGDKNNYVTGGLQFYYGFSGDTMNPDNNLPLDITKNSYKGWLPSSFSSSIKEVQTTALGSINAAKYCFWIAYPDTDDTNTDDINDTITNKHYRLIANSDKFKIEVLMKDGMNFDLVSPDQPLKSTTINVQIGNMNKTIQYKIAYVDFQNPIGNVNNILKFTIATKTGAGEAII